MSNRPTIEVPETKTVEDVKSLFGQTIFWNWLAPVNEGLIDPHHADTEYPLTVTRYAPKPEEAEDVAEKFGLYFEQGEDTVAVAEMTVPLRGEGGIGEAEAQFIASLPVSIPLLLRRILELEQLGHTLLAVTHHQRSCPSFQGGGGRCNCGIDLIRKGARAALGAE